MSTQDGPTLQQRLDALVADMIDKGILMDEAHRQMERQFLRQVLCLCDGNQCRAAETLKVHRNTLRRKLQRHGLL